MTTHYDTLGVEAAASDDDIKRAYYARARMYHPDAHVRSTVAVRDEAEQAMRALNQAWHVLRDPARRSRYDRVRRVQAAQDEERGSANRRYRTPGRRRDPTAKPRVLSLGAGFQYWLGSAGSMQRDAHGQTRFNLRVTGSTSLEPLRVLAPARLSALHAGDSMVDDRQLIHLQAMSGLRVLDLSGTRITDAGLVHLQGCTGLETLMLWGTQVTDAGLDLIARLPSLRQLGLGNTAITDRGLVHLAGLSRLRLLQLWGTTVEGPGLRHLHRLRELEVLTLPWRVRGTAKRALRRALPHTSIVS